MALAKFSIASCSLIDRSQSPLEKTRVSSTQTKKTDEGNTDRRHAHLVENAWVFLEMGSKHQRTANNSNKHHQTLVTQQCDVKQRKLPRIASKTTQIAQSIFRSTDRLSEIAR
jgi:hypothetical protein